MTFDHRNDPRGPRLFKFGSADAAFEHVRTFKGIEFGDEVIVHRNEDDLRAVFMHWDERGFAVLSYYDEDKEINGMACPLSCLSRPE